MCVGKVWHGSLINEYIVGRAIEKARESERVRKRVGRDKCKEQGLTKKQGQTVHKHRRCTESKKKREQRKSKYIKDLKYIHYLQ